MNIKNVETQIHEMAQSITPPVDALPIVIYLMGRIASGKGYVLEVLKRELPTAEVIGVSDIVSALSGAVNRKSLQGTAHLAHAITSQISSLLCSYGVRRKIVIVDGIRQPQILLPLMHFYGGTPVWVEATPTVRSLRYEMRGSLRDKHTTFAEADELDIKLGIDALYACLGIMPETVTVTNHFTLSEIKRHTEMIAVAEKPVMTRVSPAPKKAPVINKPVEDKPVAPTYHIPTLLTPGVTDITFKNQSVTAHQVSLPIVNKPDIKIKIWTNSPDRVVNGSGTAMVKLITAKDDTSVAIMTDADGYQVYSAKGNRGISLKRYLMGPNFSMRNEDAKPTSYLVSDFRAKVDTETEHHFICVHALKMNHVPVAITYYDVDRVAIVTRTLVPPVDTGNAEIDWLTRCQNSGIKCEVPNVFANWNRVTGN